MRFFPLHVLFVLSFVSAAAQPAQAVCGRVIQLPSNPSLATPIGFTCKKVDGKLVCGNFSKSGDAKNDNEADDDDKPKKSKKVKDKPIPETCGKKVNCDVGYVKLEKPNKYGACCEPREGLPPPKSTAKICCVGVHEPTGGGATYCDTDEASARAAAAGTKINGEPVTKVTCAPE